MYEIKPLRTDKDLTAALAEIERLWGARPGSEDGDRLEVITTLVEAYEAQHHPVDLPDAISAIDFRLEQAGMTHKDLEPILGGRTRTWEVMHGRRRLSMRMVQNLHRELGVPLKPLVMSPLEPEIPAKKKAAARRPATARRASGGGRSDH